MKGENLKRPGKRLLAATVVAVAGAIWGIMLLTLNLGQGLRQASYDLPFLFGEGKPPEELVLVYLDEASHQELGQPLAQPWDRRLHAKLVDRLRDAGARTIVFDILFSDDNPEQDPAFAEAIRRHGNVILAGELIRIENETGTQERLLLATPELRRVAAGWGLTEMPIDADGVVRRVRNVIETPFGPRPGLSALVYENEGEGGEIPESFLLNYYGPSGSFAGYSIAGVLSEGRVDPEVFRDRIVIVGARQEAGLADAGKDTFATPYTSADKELTPGMEIHATALANLIDGNGIRRASGWSERSGVLLAAIIFSASACLLAPIRGVSLCVLMGLGVAVSGLLARHAGGTLQLWAIPAFGQMPLIAGLALAGHYLIEYSARWKLRRAFRSYMSDEQARQIDEDEVSLELGGKEVEATILFSDLAGFTSMSEGLPPQSVSKALISYFEAATEGILDNDGTIIKYVGDAVMATWGAPLKVDREADRAIEAAIQMQQASARPITLETDDGIREQVLETRIGINSGPGLAGNLGSKRRFDYSVIGDTTNTAARLEGLNKMLGTSILVADSVLAKCDDRHRFVTREMGTFVLKGRSRGLVVHEVLGFSENRALIRNRDEAYLAAYASGLAAFRKGDFSLAWTSFEAALRNHDRKSEDPASHLFLKALEERDPNREWTGEIVLDSK